MFRLFAEKDPTKQFAGLTDEEWFKVLVRSIRARSIRGVKFPRFPPEDLQRMFVGSAGELTLREAFTFFKAVKSYAESAGVPFGLSTRVLDFGCGWGRIMRCYLRDVSASNLHGVDVDEKMVDLCRSLYGRLARFEVVPAHPPAATIAGPYDIIYLYSVL